MTFKEATDRLLRRGFTAEDIGRACGVSANTILRARRSEGQVRPEPKGWRPALWSLAQDGVAELTTLTQMLGDA